MTPEEQDKLMKWFLFGFLTLALVPLWKFSRDFTRPTFTALTPPIAGAKPYRFPSGEATIMQDLSGASRVRFGMGQITGPNSINCGSVNPYSSKRAAADACAVAAFKDHKPFRLMYQTGGRTEIINWGIASNAKGQVFFLRNVEPGVGIQNYVAGETLYACKQPIVVSVKGRPRIACKENRNLTP